MNILKAVKTISLLIVGLLFSTSVFSQIQNPIKWKHSVSEISGGKYEITFTAQIDEGWHLYSTAEMDLGPVPTTINYESGVVTEGDITEEIKPEKHFDKAFQTDLEYWSNEAIIKQVVEVSDTDSVSGYVEFMGCNDEMCLPPDTYYFSFATGEQQEVASIPTVSEDAGSTEGRSYWGIFFLAFLGGLAALLTPCVFPMIPMTVSFFTKQSTNRAVGIKNASIYGFFIILIYVLLGTGVVAIFGADALNALSTNPWFNLFFFALLVVFAISFLGAFEIVLPSKWVNSADKGVDKGGIAGSFFMALTLALVSFSCTGPIVGTLLVSSASGGGMAPLVGMLGFSLALALPFALFAAFPGFLNSLPKSGGWLNSVKVVLGFLELALAFKFLSNADLVLDLQILTREVFIAIWIAVFGVLTLYLFGKIQLPHDSEVKKLSVGRLTLALTTLFFTIYMVPGLWGAPLKLISAFPPPLEYAESPQGLSQTAAIPVHEADITAKSNGGSDYEMHTGPQGLSVFHDYDEALAYAKEVNKPLFLDFTGKACVNCRQMEINVWSDPEVNRLMKNEYVIAALYVDYRKQLPENEQYVSESTGKKIRTVGNKWSDFQISRYKTNSQPYYVILDHNENPLAPNRAYNADIPEYKQWLQSGLESFSNIKVKTTFMDVPYVELENEKL